ncbi:hypothetical protein PAXRUDRAFT_822831 [Paxillus rubicundulus Ve08.2h10]|uniref:C3H1-type domain-containing protein n=1 Tax=Paxillus rubicundulus Ve08.2h10 TaxID=930991 RepID=A0A0D0DW30_9AGAM|nr:hypothetical protein PAXRUDRAFT_822831 [Paxillus rubicundulus Ve08.2h10]
MASTSDAALKAEIARLTGAINQHKSTQQQHGAFAGPSSYRRSNTYVNPNYKPPSNSKSQGYRNDTAPPLRLATSTVAAPSTRDIVIGGIAFETSFRSLVRKDLPKPPQVPIKAPLRPIPQQTDFSRTANGHRIPAGRGYKSKVSSRTQPRRPGNRNMTLNNTRGPSQGRRANKRMKYLDKPCPRFTTTGACSRGLTCMYQHDPNKIAICWNFLHGNCSNTAETCNLSHDPLPERTPLCVHFANNGRCTRENCPYPHVRVGQRHGVCRDFAVLGYCSKGLDCEMQHVRECPDFAEKATCSTKGCKLPHVIRANRSRKVISAVTTAKTGSPSENIAVVDDAAVTSGSTGSDNVPNSQHVSVQDAQLGDEYISLMFNESEESADDDDDDRDEDEEESDEEEGECPTTEDDGLGPSD